MTSLEELLKLKAMLGESDSPEQITKSVSDAERAKELEETLAPKSSGISQDLMDRYQKMKEAKAAEARAKIPNFELGESSPVASEMTREDAALARIRNAVKQNEGVMIGAPKDVKPDFQQILNNILKERGKSPVEAPSSSMPSVPAEEAISSNVAKTAGASDELAMLADKAKGLGGKALDIGKKGLDVGGKIAGVAGKYVLPPVALYGGARSLAKDLSRDTSEMTEEEKAAIRGDVLSHGSEALAGGLGTAGAGLELAGAPVLGGAALSGAAALGGIPLGYMAGKGVSSLMGGEYKGPVKTDPNAPLLQPEVNAPMQEQPTPDREVSGMGPLADKEKYKEGLNFEQAFDKGMGALWDTESGGKQFDKNGKPIISGAGAVGVSQILPSTGPEAAKLAGLPWDESKLYNDEEYNRALGKAYFRKQLENAHGDFAQAYAAYNAGPGAVRLAKARAVQAGTPDEWLSYLPEETKNYVSKNMEKFGGEGLTPRGIGPVSDAKKYAAMLNDDQEQQSLLKNMAANGPRPPVDEAPEEGRGPSSESLAQTLFNPESLNTIAKLREAQGAANDQTNQANLFKAIEMLNSGLIGKSMGVAPPKSNTEFWDQYAKQGQQKVEQFKDLAEQEKNDPESAASKNMNKFVEDTLKKAGFETGTIKGMSYNDLQKIFPQITNLATQKQAQEARTKDLELKREMLQHEKQKGADNQERNIAARQLGSIGKTVANSGGARGNQLRNGLDQAARIFRTVGVDDKLSPKEIEDLDVATLDKNKKLAIMESALELNKLMSGSGAPASKTLDKLILKSGASNAVDALDWLTNKQNPRQQGEYLKDILKAAGRVRDYNREQLTEMNQGVISSLGLAKKHYPDQYKQFLESNNLMDTEEYNVSKKEAKSQPSMVKVISPQGITGSIPKEKLSEALKRGFKQVQ